MPYYFQTLTPKSCLGQTVRIMELMNDTFITVTIYLTTFTQEDTNGSLFILTKSYLPHKNTKFMDANRVVVSNIPCNFHPTAVPRSPLAICPLNKSFYVETLKVRKSTGGATKDGYRRSQRFDTPN
jgi:hypothetical protein